MAITLNTKVYGFRGFDANGISVFFNTAAGIARGFLKLTNKVDGDPSTSNVMKVRWKLKLPTLATDTTSGAKPGDMIRESFADIVVSVAAGATQAERDDLALQLQGLTATPEFQASVKQLIAPSA